jgi:hypothetical protein
MGLPEEVGMPSDVEVWLPGSFTKNFSWGQPKDKQGLKRLYDEIRVGFGGLRSDVPRNEFRSRVKDSTRPDYIPLNFFLFNKIIDGIDYVIFDELVFQALSFPHSKAFDLLALFAFNLSLVGVWRGATPAQRRPTLWANAYIRERVAGPLNWDTNKISADDIESFILNDPRYKAKTSRKVATNLNHQFLVGGLSGFNTNRIERWWVNALFLALDRLIENRAIDGMETRDAQLASLLAQSGFLALTGKRSLEKELAIKHLVRLYAACGGRERFSDEQVRELTRVRVHDIESFLANDERPGGAVHPTNPRILKTIPRACALLATYAGFEFLLPDDLEHFDVDDFVRRRTTEALRILRDKNVRPTMSADELMKITRER